MNRKSVRPISPLFPTVSLSVVLLSVDEVHRVLPTDMLPFATADDSASSSNQVYRYRSPAHSHRVRPYYHPHPAHAIPSTSASMFDYGNPPPPPPPDPNGMVHWPSFPIDNPHLHQL